MKFDKSPLTFEKQLQKIQNKYDIEINNKELALHYLKHCNYYKLRGYWLYFEQKKQKATGRPMEKSAGPGSAARAAGPTGQRAQTTPERGAQWADSP